MQDMPKPQGKDIPMADLVPLRERGINLATHAGFRKILSSIRTVGLIEPLCIYRDNGKYCILDGFLRYKACEQLGIARVPCLVYDTKEAYTFNKMVNRLSPVQETRMLRTSLKTIDEATIAEVFGLRSIRHRVGTALLRQLHPQVVKALDANLVSRVCATEFTYVIPKQQLQMLREMERNNDYSPSFARALVVKTPDDLRNKKKRQQKPWVHDPAKKKELVAKLEEVEKRHDFYTNLYRQYSTDLLKLCIYVRKLITNQKVREFLEERYPDQLARFEEIVFQERA